MTTEEREQLREQLKAEILEEIKAERKGMTAWRRYTKEELKPKIESIVQGKRETCDVYKLLQSLNQFVSIALDKKTPSIREHEEIEKAKKIAEIYIKAYEEAQALS